MLITALVSVKSLGEKYQALRELEKGISNKDVTEQYGVTKTPFQRGLKTN